MPLYYNNAQVRKMTYNGSELKVCNYNNVKVFSSVPAWYATLKSMSVGGTITIDGYEWILVHKTSTAAVLGLHYWYMDTIFGANTTYAGSTIAGLCATFESNTLSSDTKSILNNVTVNGVTAKVFIPSYEQMNGGFSYYDSRDKLIFTDSSGTRKNYWTSSTYTQTAYVWYVYTLLYLTGAYPSYNFGFRPHMEVNITF